MELVEAKALAYNTHINENTEERTKTLLSRLLG
jgi:hypothetical protein